MLSSPPAMRGRMWSAVSAPAPPHRAQSGLPSRMIFRLRWYSGPYLAKAVTSTVVTVPGVEGVHGDHLACSSTGSAELVLDT